MELLHLCLWAQYSLLSSIERKLPPLDNIVITLGPKEKINNEEFQWWELRGNKFSGEYFAIRVLSENAPMLISKKALFTKKGNSYPQSLTLGKIKRYILREGDDEPIEYVNLRTGDALLPKFNFLTELLPQPLPTPILSSLYSERMFSEKEYLFAPTGSYLGHVVSLVKTGEDKAWSEWPSPLVIKLDPELIVYMYGLARDEEGHYIYEGDYHYVNLTREEVEELISLGMNCFKVDDKYEEWLYRKPVFYYKEFSTDSKIKYPEILYRSNYRGAVPFIDEPAIHLLGDRHELDNIRRPEDGGYLLTKRLEEFWNKPGIWRRTMLREQLQKLGINLGTLTLDDNDHPIWETLIETAFYQLQGGAAGILHEGRYQLNFYIELCERLLGPGVELSTKEMLLLNYAILRGAARTFKKDWGVAIYGQCDPEIAPLAVALAYDLGARYIWFWTYDHQHHLPHFMKLKLLKHLQEHKSLHPRKDLKEILYGERERTAIVLPYGYTFFFDTTYNAMWASPFLGLNYKNIFSVPYREVLAAALCEGIICAKSGEEFDFVVDIGQREEDFKEYSRVIKICADGKEIILKGKPSTPVAPCKSLKPEEIHIETEKRDKISSDEKADIKIPFRENIKVDGDLSEWQGSEWITLDKSSQYVGNNWNGPQDLSVSIAFARNEKCLFLAARVTDDKFFQDKSGELIWQGDSIQVAIDPLLDRAKGYYAVDDIEFGIALTSRGPETYMWKKYGDEEPSPIPGAEVVIKQDKDKNETIYEASIPWDALLPQPISFMNYCGMTFLVNDNDGGGRKGYLEFTPGIGASKDPSSYKIAYLEKIPDTKLPDISIVLYHTYRVVNTKKASWELTGEALCRETTKIQLQIRDENGKKIISGPFSFNLPAGHHRFKIIFNCVSENISPGIFRGRLLFLSNNKIVYETPFTAYVF
jgi:hypothetical protein